MKSFTIEATNLHWIKGDADDPRDYCLHGKATAKIGDRALEFDECAVSATALYLLKSLTEDHIIFKESVQMLPCCGHYIIPNDDLSAVTISGCNSGVDWSVVHCGDNVKLILEDGYEVEVPLDEYKDEVFRFADKIEAFYLACSPKIYCGFKVLSEWNRQEYIAFWNEWRRRRGKKPELKPEEIIDEYVELCSHMCKTADDYTPEKVAENNKVMRRKNELIHSFYTSEVIAKEVYGKLLDHPDAFVRQCAATDCLFQVIHVERALRILKDIRRHGDRMSAMAAKRTILVWKGKLNPDEPF